MSGGFACGLAVAAASPAKTFLDGATCVSGPRGSTSLCSRTLTPSPGSSLSVLEGAP